MFYPYLWRYRSRIPIISVGNVHSGGSGKTPLVAQIVDHFVSSRPVVVSRGYHGRRSRSGAKVSLEVDDGAHEYGDEPWMLAKRLPSPVYVGRRRSEVLRVVEALEDTRLVVLDDGFQHLALHRDIDIVVVNADKVFDDRYCIPLGELREPLSAIARADAVCLVQASAGPDGTNVWRDFLSQRFPKVPLFDLKRVALDLTGPEPWKENGRALAFCGIGAPSGFQSLLTHWPGVQWGPVFPDHHDYQREEVAQIVATAKEKGIERFVTTEKDWVKTQGFFEELKVPLHYLRMKYDIPPDFWAFLSKRLAV